MYSEKLNNLILTADDFGISEKANRKILALVREKKLDRVAVMMGGKIFENDAKELLESGVKLDIHFHLCSGEYFATRTGELKRGALTRVLLFLLDFSAGRYSKSKIKIIWRKQMEDFRATFGKYPDGLSSHEHLHFFPVFFDIALKFKEKYQIAYMRLGRKKLKTSLCPVAVILNAFRKINLKKKLDINTSDYLVSFDWIKNTAEFFGRLPEEGQAEIVFHPERDNEFEFLKENF
jgi:predicted glycoside hydrolase/deacetylase ChbG (UPF0249 family)